MFLQANHVKAFYSSTRHPTLASGLRAAVELGGLGKLSPNMALLGFQEHWWISRARAEEYVQVI